MEERSGFGRSPEAESLRVEQAREATGWELRVADELETTDPPTEEDLQALRDLRERTEAANKEMRVLDDLVHKSWAAKE
ncbi:MAG: hypothetical protein AVDCRST_MAG80-598 [uncultured Rubrobacteraceae bacterium]|uniref:Uncharacterized protein n=1 Tax=uncultured Rubrobacteraceae bacterium TaxID=349277 RepID=A0A6J4Q2J6_9ACTN|nr:MAG: hypothetical protein AVDCRST_MAG80-598 [uncultured Rubrobacteraceae bacterium]